MKIKLNSFWNLFFIGNIIINERENCGNILGRCPGGSISYESKGDMVKQQQNLEFSEVLDIGEVMGVYIEELYMPVK